MGEEMLCGTNTLSKKCAAIESDPRWQAVVMRDASAAGNFVYAVKTTGVYCRPACPSRLAKPENVSFFATCEAAEAAGYRPCQRCAPDSASAAEKTVSAIERACRLIEASDELPRLRDLAARVGMSQFYFHKQFKSVTGLTPKVYMDAMRARRMRVALSKKGANVTKALYSAGYNSDSRFYEKADEVLGMTPTVFMKGGKDTDIRFAVGECALGLILVACSDRGVCAIAMGDDAETLVRDLHERFPQANLIGGDQAFENIVATVINFVEAPQIGLDLPLDLRGTAFQQRVWQALQKIPVGETVSYTNLAQQIGKPKAVRAVAKACGANAIAVAIPCHRVIRRDGALSGYCWGVERKRALLEREKKV